MSVRDKNAEIYVMNANGTGQRNLTHNAADDSSPRWSPDGKQIFFISDRDGDQKPFVMNAGGSSQTRVADIAAPYADLAVGVRR
jgi:Tol biopolymer transport system component